MISFSPLAIALHEWHFFTQSLPINDLSLFLHVICNSDATTKSMGQIISFIKNSFVCRFFERRLTKQSEETTEDLEDQNGQHTLLDPSSEVDTDSSFRFHQNVGTNCFDIVEENNNQHESVSCALNVEDLEEGQITGSVPERWIRHYCSTQWILVVGDGDFSFSVSLARAFGSATNMVATSLDSRVMLHYKYTRAMDNLKELEELGCTIIHEVDCCTMSQHHELEFFLFDRIVYNFPHAGFFTETATWVIERHKSVVRGFMRNAAKMLTDNGEVHITHKTTYPFNQWRIKNIAKKAGLRLIDEVPFSSSDYPGYRNKYGAGTRPDQSFPVGACSTYKFKKEKNTSSHLQV